jgi:glycosyltransferase 2 family protein
VSRGRLFKTAILVAGVVGLAIAVKETISDAHGRVLPSPAALAIGEVLAFVTIVCACRTWTALFDDVLDTDRARHRLRSTFYLSQLTKYVPAAGGIVQVTSQVGMATATGLPIGRVAVAFPTAGLSSVAAGSVLGAGLVFATGLPTWARALAPLGLVVPLLLNRTVLAWFLGVARRFVKRIPAAEKLPSQRSILISFFWAVVAIGSAGASYAVLVRSLVPGTNALILFCAYSLAWVIGFIALPIPAGIGIREAVVIAAVPGVNKGVLIAASLALRFLGLAAELTSAGVNRLILRRRHGEASRSGKSGPGEIEPAAT